MKAMDTNELRWAESHAPPHMNYHRSLEEPEDPNRYISLLRQYLRLAPWFLPESTKTDQAKTLSHPDLHLDNIFVDPDTKRITHIIDWQSAAISDVFLQHRFPQMLKPLEPGAGETVPGNQQTMNDSNPTENFMTQYYERLLKERNPRRSAILDEDHLPIRTKPVSIVSGSWEREDLFSFRHSLISIAANWSSLVGANGAPCPFDLSAEEYACHESEMELLEGLSTIMHQLHNQNLIPLGGMVRREYFEGVQKANARCKQWFVDMGGSDRQRELHAKVWPYQDL
jgi:hypothetical protein